MKNIFETALALFFLMDSIGNIPLFLSLLKHVPKKRQRFVIFRELLIALCTFITFIFIGDFFLKRLGISKPSLLISGGLILFLIAIRMIFPSATEQEEKLPKTEPFIVPLAIPMVAGPAVLAALMVYATTMPKAAILFSTFLAWGASTFILIFASSLREILGKKGVLASEKLMGLILTLIAVEMFLDGLKKYIQDYS